MRQRVLALKKKLLFDTVPIEAADPKSWHDLQVAVRRILRESGLTTRMDMPVRTARGDVDVDVYAVDQDAALPNAVIVECKYWRRKVSKSVVHSVRSVVADAGANTGLIVSRAGFQPGAVQAAKFTNVRLMTWSEFQRQFVDRWFLNYMLPRMQDEAEPLVEYTEEVNSRVLRKFSQLSTGKQQAVRALRMKYLGLARTDMVFGLLVIIHRLCRCVKRCPGSRRWGSLTMCSMPRRSDTCWLVSEVGTGARSRRSMRHLASAPDGTPGAGRACVMRRMAGAVGRTIRAR